MNERKTERQRNCLKLKKNGLSETLTPRTKELNLCSETEKKKKKQSLEYG